MKDFLSWAWGLVVFVGIASLLVAASIALWSIHPAVFFLVLVFAGAFK